MRRIIIALAFLAAPFLVRAQSPLTINLKLIPDRQLLGCPVRAIVSMKNQGGAPIQIPPIRQMRYVITLKCTDHDAVTFNHKGSFDGHLQWEILKPGKKILPSR